jgi:hypothetical protein
LYLDGHFGFLLHFIPSICCQPACFSSLSLRSEACPALRGQLIFLFSGAGHLVLCQEIGFRQNGDSQLLGFLVLGRIGCHIIVNQAGGLAGDTPRDLAALLLNGLL